MKPPGYRPILTTRNAKTVKGERRGFYTAILYLAPSTSSGYGNTCPMASVGCQRVCLGEWSGRNQMPASKRARLDKTRLYYQERERFLESLRYDISAHIRAAARRGLVPAVRINGSSDLPQLALTMAQEFAEVQFYDYTKVPQPWKRTAPNYHLTFSLSESNEAHALAALEHGVNVAVVFRGERPKTWRGYRVIDGDRHDLRFLDPRKRKGVIVGLTPKGKKAREDDTGFVVDHPGLVQIAAAAAA